MSRTRVAQIVNREVVNPRFLTCFVESLPQTHHPLTCTSGEYPWCGRAVLGAKRHHLLQCTKRTLVQRDASTLTGLGVHAFQIDQAVGKVDAAPFQAQHFLLPAAGVHGQANEAFQNSAKLLRPGCPTKAFDLGPGQPAHTALWLFHLPAFHRIRQTPFIFDVAPVDCRRQRGQLPVDRRR
ncbi:hypothetical protein D3C77_569700 [compost metagenome]